MGLKPFRFGVVAGQARSGAAWVELARRTESLGFATLLVPDTLGQTLAPLPALTAAAAATATLRLGTYVLANDYRRPTLVAREALTLGFLSGGRFELGIGAGRPGAESDYRALGLAQDPGGVRVARLAEALRVIGPLLRGEPASLSGAHYRVEGAAPFPPPAGGRVPILIAASGPRLLALAAREADTVALALGPQAEESDYAEKVALLRDAAGERADQIELNLNLTMVGDALPPWLAARMGMDREALARSTSPALLRGDVDAMCDRLLRLRERLGISYICCGDFAAEALAPVVARLAGT